MQKRLLTLLFFIFSFIHLYSQTVDPLLAKDAKAQEMWVDSILKYMSLDEKIGQLFMIQAYSNKGAKHEQFVRNMITKYHVGNLIFMQGTPERQVVLNNKYQALTKKVPLLIGFDGEWGLDMRLKNTYRFPWNMTLGAIQDNALLEEFGKRLGEHCKRVGIHMNFAPVVDINTNPNNPIIGNRSFGERKENVTEKAIAMIKGIQGVGVLANAKHFPGHGDTATDSHHTLPTISFSEKRLDSIELYPFKKTFDAGVASVMTAHLSIPSLEQNIKLPSSLSKNVVTNLLQKKLGFRGLVLTDGLNMKGAANYSSSAAINLAAIQAGNDMLLIPQDVPASFRLLKRSVLNGTLPKEQLNHSVRKILKAKYWAGLHNYKPIQTQHIQEDINSFKDEVLHRKLLKNSITMLKNDSILPIKDLADKKIAYVSLGDDKGEYFYKTLKKYTQVNHVSATSLPSLMTKLDFYDLVIVGFHKSNKSPWKPYKFSKKDLGWLQKIAKTHRVILDVFASPYSLLQVSSFADIEGLLVSYQNSKIAQELSAQAIFGAIKVKGKLPVSINNVFRAGDGLTAATLQRLQYTIPEEVGVSSTKLADIDKHIDTILKKRMTPGGQILVARHGKVIYNKSFGHHTYAKKQKVTNSDIYDLASLTKILGSLPVIMKAEEDRKLSIYSRISDLLPSFRDSNKDTLEVKEILSHCGKLRSWIPFYMLSQDSITGENSSELYRKKRSRNFSIQVAKNMYLLKSYKDSIRKYIKDAEQRTGTRRYKYSDLGYYMFKDILESKYKKRLDRLVENMFYKSLGLNRTSYLPLERFAEEEIVPSEVDDYFRHQKIHGYVHDMGAAMQGGVGAHAGLFANANDVAKIMQMYLQNGSYGGKQYIKPETIRKFNTRYYADDKVRRGLGFDKPQLTTYEKPTCGCVSDKSFGHSGFTGTYAWADPESGIVYIFLSNRTYPSMRNSKLVRSNVRTKIQRSIQNAIIDCTNCEKEIL